MKGTEEIIADIKYYKEKYGIRSFWFTHDAFTVNRQLVNEICDRILEEKLDIVWRCSARLDCISEELILKMKQAGMVRMSFGVETGSPRMQKIINKHLDLKKAKGLVDFLLKEGVLSIEQKKTKLVQKLIEGLKNIPKVIFYGSEEAKFRGDAVSFNILGKDCSILGTELEEQFSVFGRSGLQCAPLAHKTIGSYSVGGTLRLSPSYFTSEAEIDFALASISKLCNQ